MTQQEINAMIINREKSVISATINGKKIKLTFEELSLINKLFRTLIDNIEEASAAYEDNGVIVVIER